jgi:uncharacterized membrane protein SirB2
LATAAILLVPFFAMQFTNEVKWTAYDFFCAALFLMVGGMTLDLIVRKVKARKHRLLLVVVLFVTLFIIWVELAVGIF